MKCVECGALLSPEEILAAGPFPCPTCHARIQARTAYGHWVYFLSVLFSAGVFYVLGFRGLHLIYAILLAWWPVLFLAMNVVIYLVPPKIELAVPRKPISQILSEGKREILRNMRERR